VTDDWTYKLGLDNALNGKSIMDGYRFDGDKVERALLVAGYRAGNVQMGLMSFPILFFSGDKADYWIVSDEPTFQATPKGGSVAPATVGGYPDLKALFLLKNEPLP
jgi:hypothetical protein